MPPQWGHPGDHRHHCGFLRDRQNSHSLGPAYQGTTSSHRTVFGVFRNDLTQLAAAAALANARSPKLRPVARDHAIPLRMSSLASTGSKPDNPVGKGTLPHCRKVSLKNLSYLHGVRGRSNPRRTSTKLAETTEPAISRPTSERANARARLAFCCVRKTRLLDFASAIRSLQKIQPKNEFNSASDK